MHLFPALWIVCTDDKPSQDHHVVVAIAAPRTNLLCESSFLVLSLAAFVARIVIARHPNVRLRSALRRETEKIMQYIGLTTDR